MAQVFTLEPKGFNLPFGLLILAVFFVPLIVLGVIDKQQYFLSVTFGALFVALVDPGGAYGNRAMRMAVFALMGAAVTALAFGSDRRLGAGWSWPPLRSRWRPG